MFFIAEAKHSCPAKQCWYFWKAVFSRDLHQARTWSLWWASLKQQKQEHWREIPSGVMGSPVFLQQQSTEKKTSGTRVSLSLCWRGNGVWRVLFLPFFFLFLKLHPLPSMHKKNDTNQDPRQAVCKHVIALLGSPQTEELLKRRYESKKTLLNE